MPLGEDLGYQLEHTMPGHWMAGMTQHDWSSTAGTVIRLASTAEHNEYGTWYLPCEIDTADTPATVYTADQQHRRGRTRLLIPLGSGT